MDILPKILYVGATKWPRYLRFYAEVDHEYFLYNISLSSYVKKKLVDLFTRTPLFSSSHFISFFLKHTKPTIIQKSILRKSYDSVIVDDEVAIPIYLGKIRATHKMFFALNSHREDWRKKHMMLLKSTEFDTVLSPHNKYGEFYHQMGLEYIYIPFGVPWMYIFPEFSLLHKNTDTVLFVGSITEGRESVIRELIKIFKKKKINFEIKTSLPSNYRLFLSKYLFQIDLNRDKEVNWRTFEVPGSGSLLISGADIEEISEFFNPNKEVFVYEYNGSIIKARKNNRLAKHIANRIAEKVEYALEDVDMARKMAIKSCEKAWKKHLLDFRFKDLFEYLGYRWELAIIPKLLRSFVLRSCKKYRVRYL